MRVTLFSMRAKARLLKNSVSLGSTLLGVKVRQKGYFVLGPRVSRHGSPQYYLWPLDLLHIPQGSTHPGGQIRGRSFDEHGAPSEALYIGFSVGIF